MPDQSTEKWGPLPRTNKKKRKKDCQRVSVFYWESSVYHFLYSDLKGQQHKDGSYQRRYSRTKRSTNAAAWKTHTLKIYPAIYAPAGRRTKSLKKLRCEFKFCFYPNVSLFFFSRNSDTNTKSAICVFQACMAQLGRCWFMYKGLSPDLLTKPAMFFFTICSQFFAYRALFFSKLPGRIDQRNWSSNRLAATINAKKRNSLE